MAEEKTKAAFGFYTRKKDGTPYKDSNGNGYMTGIAQRDIDIKKGERYNCFKNFRKKEGDLTPDWNMVKSNNDHRPKEQVNDGDIEL